MKESCVVTIRVMLDTDQEEKARDLAPLLEETLWEYRNLIGNRAVLDTEVTEFSLHPGRSFSDTRGKN